MPTRINPSILAADFANLERELGRIRTADLVHVDIMDNHFVPNLTFGPPVVERYLDLLPEFDQVLVMTVEPGFGGQGFMVSTMPKLSRLADAVRASGLDVWLQVDGGITEETIVIAAEAGANTFVAGSSVFNAADPAAQIARLRAAAAEHSHEH